MLSLNKIFQDNGVTHTKQDPFPIGQKIIQKYLKMQEFPKILTYVSHKGWVTPVISLRNNVCDKP